MPNLITIYWRDIPAQVMAKQGRQRARHQLSERFQVAIDRAAMRAKKTNADAYLDDWYRHTEKQRGDIHELVQQQADKLEAAYNDKRLEAIIKNKGKEPTLSVVSS